MTPADIRSLLKFAKKMCPQQDWGVPELERWMVLMANVPGDYLTSEQAVIAVRQRQTFMDVSDVIKEMKTIREDRMARTPTYEVPDFGDDDLYRPSLAAAMKAISDGGQGLGGPLGAIEAFTEDDAARALDASVQVRAMAHGRDPEFVRMRDGSLSVSCPWCKVSPGEVCVTGEGRDLTLEPAHRIRLESTVPPLVQPLPRKSREERLADLEALVRAEEAERG